MKFGLIVGCGRSGTCLLGRTLAKVHSIQSDVEVKPIFGMVAQSAIFGTPTSGIVSYYKSRKRQLQERDWYFDKSHPIMWILDVLDNSLDFDLVLAIERNPYSVVSITLRHNGVLSRIKEWAPPGNPFHNRFIGAYNNPCYSSYSITKRITLKWISHYLKLRELNLRYPERFLLLNYDHLLQEGKSKDLNETLGLEVNFERLIDTSQKWRKYLSSTQVAEISKTLAEFNIGGFHAQLH